MKRIERIPVPLLPTMVGAATLSNIYLSHGHSMVRHITMWISAAILICYILKIVTYPKTVKSEYDVVVPASLYPGFTMLSMILGSYIFEYNQVVGKTLWLAAIAIHALHIVVFTIRNIIKKRDINTFLPSWFVTYNGIMVSCVIGVPMNEPELLTFITYYGIAIYAILIPFMVYRLIKFEVKPPVYHTQAVVLAPCSLCIVSYLNVIQDPVPAVVLTLYLCVLASLAFIIIKLPKFFAFSFTPGFAGLTFPMAIGTVASTKAAAYFMSIEHTTLGNLASHLVGIQMYLTTFIVGYVLINFVIMLLRLERKTA